MAKDIPACCRVFGGLLLLQWGEVTSLYEPITGHLLLFVAYLATIFSNEDYIYSNEGYVNDEL
jgi:hypothetical protein